MVHACSIRPSGDFGVQHCHRCSGHQTSMMAKGRLHFGPVSLSSHALQRDAWSLHVLNGLRGPIKPVSSRCSVFVCRSVFIPGGGNKMPILKSAAVVLTRSYDTLCGNPQVLQLISAVGAVAFAVWGLGPIMRQCRIIILRKTDSTWDKSTTHYVMTSYLRPLLLWTGATLICRALDPVALPSEASQAIKQRVLNFVRSLTTMLVFAYCLSSLIQPARKFFGERNDYSDATNMGFSFIWKVIYYAVWVAAISLFMELLGFSTQKCLTAGGLGTVLITLAGREIFENFLAGVMVHATQPFVENEWIQTKIGGSEVSGIVEHVGWWSPTIIRGDDREAVHIPNHKFTGSIVRNLSQKTHWRIKNYLAISHLDVHKIDGIIADMRKVLAKNPQVEHKKLHRRVFFENINPENQALMILVSCFAKTSRFEEYLCVKEGILLDLLRVISHHRARLATPIRTVQKYHGEADLENVPFADTIFSGSTSAVNRPLLLIEPSYKVNGEDKSKVPIRSAFTNEESDDERSSTSDIKAADDKEATSMIDSKEDDAKVMTPPSSNSGTAAPETQKQQSNKESSADDLKPVSGGEKPETQTVISQANQDQVASSPSMARPALEDNIVLGVALEGSKRTLPIDDDGEASQSPVGKDKKDGPMSAVPNAKAD